MSNLPKGRGFSPLQWQILKNICLIEALFKFDSGNIFLKKIKLDGFELYDEIHLQTSKNLYKINY